jgi:hypothetical protein
MSSVNNSDSCLCVLIHLVLRTNPSWEHSFDRQKNVKRMLLIISCIGLFNCLGFSFCFVFGAGY